MKIAVSFSEDFTILPKGSITVTREDGLSATLPMTEAAWKHCLAYGLKQAVFDAIANKGGQEKINERIGRIANGTLRERASSGSILDKHYSAQMVSWLVGRGVAKKTIKDFDTDQLESEILAQVRKLMVGKAELEKRPAPTVDEISDKAAEIQAKLLERVEQIVELQTSAID